MLLQSVPLVGLSSDFSFFVLAIASLIFKTLSLQSNIDDSIEKYVGMDLEGTYRDNDEMGSMYFTKTLEDWAKFNINDRTKHDAAISSGLAIMANQRYTFSAVKKDSKISIKFARYNNNGISSKLIR